MRRRPTRDPPGSATLPRVTSPPSPDALLGQPLPDLTLPDSSGAPFRLRRFVPERPLVLFFYVLNGTPG